MTRLDNANYVIDWLGQHGFRGNPVSRLVQMRESLRGISEYDTPEFWVALESLRDLVELGFIFENLEGHVHSPIFREKVSRLFLDNPLPQDDRRKSHGRDTQWELYLAAICQGAGMTPLSFDENDVVCELEAMPFCIEAKRIKSESGAKKRIKEAINQVRKGGRLGVVALDMSLAWNPANKPIVELRDNLLIDSSLAARAHQFFTRHQAWLDSYSEGKGVLGIVLFNFVMRKVGQNWRPHRNANWLALPAKRQDQELFQTFESRFCSVIPNRQETILKSSDVRK